VATYARADNPLFFPESHFDATFGRYFFYALGHGAIGFSPFGIDRSMTPAVPNPQGIIASEAAPRAVNPAENFALFHGPEQQIAELNLDGRLFTAVEDKGAARQAIHLPGADAVVSFGFPQPDGAYPPGTPTQQGRALVAQLGPLDFLVTGFDVSVSFVVPADALEKQPNQQMEILRAEEGQYVDGAWQASRILNGDQTDRGLNFRGPNPTLVRIHLHTLPLYDEAVHRSAQ
jgi:hypothetical protein